MICDKICLSTEFEDMKVFEQLQKTVCMSESKFVALLLCAHTSSFICFRNTITLCEITPWDISFKFLRMQCVEKKTL